MLNYLEKFSTRLNALLAWTGAAALGLTMVMAVVNMALRPVGHPVTGSFELMGLGCAITTALGLALAQEQKSHIWVDIVFNRLPCPVKNFFTVIGNLACSALFIAASWRLFHMGLTQMHTGEVSETLGIPFYPVVWSVAAGFFTLALRLILEAVKAGLSLVMKR